jgi:hypothetical protein
VAKTHFSDLDLEQPGIEAGEVNSQLAPAGAVLAADGQGGAGWTAPLAKSEGTALVIGDPAGGSAGANAIDIGRNRTAAKRAGGESSIVIGQGAAYTTAGGAKAVAIGYGAQAKDGAHMVVIGAEAVARGGQSILIGGGAAGNSSNSIGVGHGCVSSLCGVVVGYLARSGYKGIAIGLRADTAGAQPEGGIALGAYAAVAASQGIAIGTGVEVGGLAAIAIGYGARATHQGSIAIGENSQAYAENTTLVGAGIAVYFGLPEVTAVGQGISVGGQGLTALGSQAQGGAHAVALGYHARANGARALAIGPEVANPSANSLKIGWNNGDGCAHFTTFTPSAGALSPTHFLPVTLGGTTFKILLAS